MKSRSIVLLIAGLIISGSINAQGQRPSGPPPPPDEDQVEEMVQDLSKQLGLSEKQEAEILDLYLDHFKEMSNNDTQKRPDPKEMESSRNKLEQEVKNLLTEEQKKQYEILIKQQKPHFKDTHQPGPPGNRPE